MKNFKTGTLIAIAAGGLFVSACKKDGSNAPVEPTPAGEEAAAPSSEAAPTPQEAAAPAPGGDEKVSKVDCAGINACKGQGGCATANNGCAGQNGCKGQGVVAMTEEECKAQGGTVSAKK